jgi:hypothetical protein
VLLEEECPDSLNQKSEFLTSTKNLTLKTKKSFNLRKCRFFGYQAFNMNPINFVDPWGEDVVKQSQLLAMYTVSKVKGYYAGSYESWLKPFIGGKLNGISVVDKEKYYYNNKNWEQGGDVISENGENYIHHDSSYTLVNTSNGTSHSFDNPFDPKGKLDNDLLDPEVARLTRETITRQHIKDKNNALYVHSGYRSFEQQKKLHDAGQGAAPGLSYHNYGLAVDIVLQNKKGGPSWPGWKTKKGKSWYTLGASGKKSGFPIWGGDFKKRVDGPHFQLNTPWRKGLNNQSVPLKIYNKIGGSDIGVKAVQKTRYLLNMLGGIVIQ